MITLTPEAEHEAMRESDLARFRSKVDTSGPIAALLGTCCWVWRGATDPCVYPKFWLRGTSVTAQRAALTLDGVDLTPDDQVVNLCRNRLCVRRSHLAVGTLSDAHALRHRGRPRVGPGELALIRLLVREEEDRVEIIAQEFGLTPHFVEQIACAG